MLASRGERLGLDVPRKMTSRAAIRLESLEGYPSAVLGAVSVVLTPRTRSRGRAALGRAMGKCHGPVDLEPAVVALDQPAPVFGGELADRVEAQPGVLAAVAIDPAVASSSPHRPIAGAPRSSVCMCMRV